MTPQEIFHSIEEILSELRSINAPGYLNTTDLRLFPIINQFIEIFSGSIKTKKDRDENSDGLKFTTGDRSMDAYKWIYNVLLLNLYELTIKLKNELDITPDTELGVESDFYADLTLLSRNLFNNLDPSIRKTLQKRGFTIIQNIQSGFDTEYVNKDTRTNKLLSIQLAVNTQTYIKIPKVSEYSLASLNPLTSEVYPISQPSGFSFELAELSIKESLHRIRLLKHLGMDSSLSSLVSKMKELSNVTYIEKDDVFVFRLPTTPMKQYIEFTTDYTLEEVIGISNILVYSDIENSYQKAIKLLELIVQNPDRDVSELLTLLNGNPIIEMIFNKDNIPLPEGFERPLTRESIKKYLGSLPKPLTRKYETELCPVKISVTRIRNNYVIGHLTSADLSILSDFETLFRSMDIVNKSYVTLGKSINYANSRIMIRDTMLLAPASKKSLSAIGKLYDLSKYELTRSEISQMDVLLQENPVRFTEYALRDAVITLTHACWMETFHFNLKGVGIPLTLSGIGNKFVERQWEKNGYEGFQISPDHLIGDASRVQTPLGLHKVGDTGLKLGMYIANYKGGRNESFMYGYENRIWWIDYDLTSAYTTVLYRLGHPMYSKGKELTIVQLLQLSDDDLLYSYTVIKCYFVFPNSVKYPSIPVYINETSTVYPLTGRAILTGAEYILARNQGCKFTIFSVYRIPFSQDQYPFKEIINEIQSKRRSFPKGSISNLMYKEIGNSIYGSLVRGMSDKRRYDNRTGGQIRIPAHFLSNPILSSWITALIRSIIGECLHGIQRLQGKVVSVTTDGFITDIKDLETQIIEKLNSKSSYLLREFKNLRKELSGDDTALEIKNEERGIITWSTRGQLGINSTIKATTGFQNREYSHSELVELFTEKMTSEDRTIEFIQSSLRSASSISKKGGHVTKIYTDQRFSMKYDNRRLIIDNFRVIDPYSSDSVMLLERDFKSIDDNIDHIKNNQYLLDSKPVTDADMCRNLRFISNKPFHTEYNQSTSKTFKNAYKNYNDLGIRNFIKFLLSTPPKLPAIALELNTYEKIIDFIHGYDPKFRVSKSSLSNLKHRKMIFNQVPRTTETIKFCDYVKSRFPKFDESVFFKSS